VAQRPGLLRGYQSRTSNINGGQDPDDVHAVHGVQPDWLVVDRCVRSGCWALGGFHHLDSAAYVLPRHVADMAVRHRTFGLCWLQF
jgi:hypothetical protein